MLSLDSILYLPNSKSQQRKEKATSETQRRIELRDRVRNNAPALKVTECGLQKKVELFSGPWRGGERGVCTDRQEVDEEAGHLVNGVEHQ
jgi:hypothetical protein